ncbi:hypothetical protein B5P43_23320 [Bacillus sp. SRB_336]|nr:hypothetical protein B5P43_23320 [Bacillus sp. SRB_336]
MSAFTATEARKRLFGLIQQVNDDHAPVEVVSRHGEFEQHDLFDA